MPLVLKWQSYRKFCLNCILEIHFILNMSQGLNIPRILHVSGILLCYSFTGYIEMALNIPRVLNMPEFGICSGNNLKITLNSNI